MAAFRHSHVAHFLIAFVACSSGAVSTGGVVNGVLAVELTPCNSNNACTDENVSDVAISSGQAFITRAKSQGGNNTDEVSVHVGNFGDGGVTQIADLPQTLEANIAFAGDAGFYVVLDNKGALSVHDFVAESVPVNTGTGGGLAGAVGTPGAIYFAAAPSQGGPQSLDPNTQFWPSTSVVDGGLQPDERSGTLFRFDVASRAFAQATESFLMTLSHHVLATDGTNVYWIAGPTPGTVMQLPLDLSGAATPVATIPSGIGNAVATNGTVVAWTSTSFATPPSCVIGSGTKTIFSTSSFSCEGLAIDQTHAYFAVVSLGTYSSNMGPTPYLAGTAFGRVDLAGPSTQTASLIDVSSSRYYGPRRVLADDAFVYGVDPSYVLRVAKTAFP